MLDIVKKALNSGRVLASWINLRLSTIASSKRNFGGNGGVGRRLLAARHRTCFSSLGRPPQINGGVYRPVSLAKYAVRAGWRVTVATGPLKGAPSAAGLDLLNSLPAKGWHFPRIAGSANKL